jgi:hypothetical protein
MLAPAARADASRYASRSALSEGKWVKIRVDKTGIYKLSYADLKKMGFADPGKVSVHGYGGWILDEDFSKPYTDDLPAVAVWRGSDYLLFYARGPVKWTYEKVNYYNETVEQFIHENNPYSMYGYYFVTDATPTGEMKSTPSVGGASLQITTFDDYMLHEKENISVNNSGRELFGESFESVLSQNFPFQIPGITDDDGRVSLRFISKVTGGDGEVTLRINDGQLIRGTIAADNNIYVKGVSLLRTAKWTGGKNETSGVNITYGTAGHKSFLDYICLQMKRQLQAYDACTFFRSLAARGNVSQFTIRNATSGMMVFDVTDGINPTQMETTLNGAELSFTIPADTLLREFVLVDPSRSIPTPETVHEVVPQNLHGLPQTEMVILAPPAFTAEAERLAQKHRTFTNIHVTVVTPEQVYNEFSSGTPDATAIRRFMKMFYDRSRSEADAPRFLLLFGDGSCDNRQLTLAWKNMAMDNFLLTYQTQNSLNSDSYVMEDYFGFLADDEGLSHSTSRLCLGIGRFPVRTVAQARAAVDKVIAYMDNKDAGNWKNNLCFVADDGNGQEPDPRVHMSQSYELTQYLERNHPEFLSNKLFFDAFKKSNTGGKAGYPDIEANIAKQLKEGTLIINYVGHGDNISWSDERVITSTQIQQATYPHLPLWITATCDFTPFDDFNTSAGEYVFLNEKSGGIGLFTTTRVAFISTNFEINKRLNEYLFKKNNGRRLTLGEVIRETKQNYRVIDRVRFVLIGDPALTLAYPEHGIRITAINGQAVTDTVDFKALEKVTVQGEVYDSEDRKMTAFNGSLSATIMDSEQTITTLDNNKWYTATGPFVYRDYPNTLQKVNDRIVNGEFTFSFIVPKDISYSGQPGKMSLYALDETTNMEAQGSFKTFRVGGTADDAVKDTVGPEIRALYLNDSTFADGGRVNETPFFVATLWDQSGVNIGGSSIGHDVMLTIDNDPLYSYNLNAYYETLAGNNGEGLVRFSVPSLSSGKHTAEFKVWDVLNNSTTRTFAFEVVKGLKPSISELIAAPSPARESVRFLLYHNRPESQMTVGIQVYDMTGRLQWEHVESGSSDLFKAYSVSWNLTNGSGSRVRPGIYLYRAAIRTATSAEATETKKLIVVGR